MKLWYIATTKHRKEREAAQKLRAQFFTVYLPKTFVRTVVSKSPVPEARLRFTGYLFVEFDYELGEHGPINKTPGIDHIMCKYDEERTPEPLRPGVIEMLRWAEEEDFAEASKSTKKLSRDDIRPGDLVRINRNGHPAHGQVGTYFVSERGVADVLCGTMMVRIADVDLKKVEKEKFATA